MRYWKTDYHDGNYKITYTPEDAGQHTVIVKFDGKEVPGSPFKVQANEVGDATQVKFVGEPKKTCNAGEEYSLTLDAKMAGEGGLTCKLTRVHSTSESKETTTERVETLPSGATKVIKETRRETKTTSERETRENIDCKVVQNADGTYAVKYKVKEPGDYCIELKFGGKPVPNGTIQFAVK